MNNGISKVSVITFIAVVAIGTYAAFFYTEHNPVSVNIQNQHQSEIVVTAKTIQEKTAYATIRAEYPQFSGVPDEFNKKIETLITTAIADHKKQSEENWKARVQTSPPGTFTQTPKEDELFEFYSSWLPEQLSPDRISVVVRFGGFAGGAHGYEDIATFNYDVKNKKEIQLGSLFPNDPNYLKTISDFSRESLAQSLKIAYRPTDIKDQKQADKWFEESVLPDIEAGTTPTLENFQNFGIRNNTIVFYFPRYQVAAYAAGEQQVVMPYPFVK